MKKLHAGAIIALAVLLVSVLIALVLMVHAYFSYANRVVPNVSIAGISLSGMDNLAAASTLQRVYDKMITKGVTITVNEQVQTIPLFQTSSQSDVAYNLLEWDPSAAAEEALSIGHHKNIVIDSLFILYYELFGSKKFSASVIVNEERLQEAILAAFPNEQIPASATDFSVSISRNKGVIVSIEPGIQGQTLNIDAAIDSIKKDARDLVIGSLPISTVATEPNITTSDAETLITAAKEAIVAAPYSISGTNTNGETETWSMSQKTIADWIIPTYSTTNGATLGLEAEKMVDFFSNLHSSIDVSAQNARFTIDGERVTEFQESTSGNVVDDEALFLALITMLGTDTSTTPLVVPTRIEEPSVTTQNVNSLGITEIVGEATTSYPTASANRRENIKHGAEKINGLLIAPGETVSLLASLRPFTAADGYVTELVIKGDEIKPEVGGGLCQLGTTAFRAVMHAGLEVTDRRNHSLAISYYNDAINGNPGTDATLYDPAPDFKFKNDMPTYLLLVTNADSEKGEVTFTFWGTKDGRQGSYEPPTVLTRTSPGPKEYKESTTLAPGKEECQHAFPGYTTTFNYNVSYADGSLKTTEFFSSYRALPEICLVGKAAEIVTTTTDSDIGSDPITTE
ncbi:MAG: VanW family protein [Patescibacteria group bacterium]|jgi:vancomycin resistance protein YoaR